MKRYLLLFVVLLGLLAGAATASAQDTITINHSDASYTFQKLADFTLEATSSNYITGAMLHFRLADQQATNIVDERVAPARSVKVSHIWDLTHSDLPSGTLVTYWWTVQDSAGNKVDSDPHSFVYEDTRFKWKKLTEDGITLCWYRGDDALAKELLDAAVSAYQRLATEYGVERKPASIYIYGSYDDLRSGIGDTAQEWTGGRAYPEYGVALIGVPPNDISFGRRAVPHEFTHLIVHRATSNPYATIPRWLDEGLAMWAEGDLEAEYRNALNAAIKSNHLLSLKSLASNFPADSNQASLAYAQSYTMIAFIRDAYGPAKIGELLKAFKAGSTDDGALQQVLGLTTAQLDTLWRASLGLAATQPGQLSSPQPLSAPLADVSPAPGGLLLVGLALMGGVILIIMSFLAIVVTLARMA
jgi:hypothetical protein